MLMLLSMNGEVPSISFLIVEQIEVVPEVVLSEVYKLIDSVMSKRQGDQRKQFFEKKGLHKIDNGYAINKHQEVSYQYFCISKCTKCNVEEILKLR